MPLFFACVTYLPRGRVGVRGRGRGRGRVRLRLRVRLRVRGRVGRHAPAYGDEDLISHLVVTPLELARPLRLGERHLQHAEQPVERRAHLVRHAREEGVLG